MTSENALFSKLSQMQKEHIITQKYRDIIALFLQKYVEESAKAHFPRQKCFATFSTFLDLLRKQKKDSYSFPLYHQKIRSPFDYYQFGINFLKPLVDIAHSSVQGIEYLVSMQQQLERKENIILLANHQTEYDPQAISILLEKDFPQFGQNIIYVAGERVITDPLAIPFSMGCDLLCIYSKKYVNTPTHLKQTKFLHNRRTMEVMRKLLSEGGKTIYVAPSGGRDRRNEHGEIEIASFDPQSLEMFYLMAKKAKTPTHFYPLTLDTYHLLPPPPKRQIEMGEIRTTSYGPIHIAFDQEFFMEKFADDNKKKLRQKRADAIYQIVRNNYLQLIGKK